MYVDSSFMKTKHFKALQMYHHQRINVYTIQQKKSPCISWLNDIYVNMEYETENIIHFRGFFSYCAEKKTHTCKLNLANVRVILLKYNARVID